MTTRRTMRLALETAGWGLAVLGLWWISPALAVIVVGVVMGFLFSEGGRR